MQGPELHATEATQFFFSITPDKILDAVEELGVRCTGRCMALNSMENRVYEVEIELEEEAKSRYDYFRVIKFYRPGRWTREQILEEHAFLFDLTEAGIPVVPPLKFADGSSLRCTSDPEIFFAIFPKFGGRLLDELKPDQVKLLGRTIARMHTVGAAKKSKHRLPLDAATFGWSNISYLLSGGAIPENFKPGFKQVADAIVQIADSWLKETPVQRVHGDFHLGNVLWADTGCTVVDFDDMVSGPAVQDLWLIIPGRDEFSAKQLETLVAAYQEMRQFDSSQLRLIEPLRALRIINFNAWIARRWDDPAFKRTFVEFGSEKYWNEQIAALMECREVLSGV
ncbi:MAG: serine/threonine protein kinase [Oligoflexia bacterium]|nr:serine/threonine protein kinase [Oligoflexia bacterium]